MKIIAFLNNKGGVGKTSLVYHLAWMYADLGIKVIAGDFDPQANLTSMFLDEDRLEELWPENEHPETILGIIKPILKGTGDIAEPHVENIEDNIGLIVGDLGLSLFEDKLSDAWPRCHDGDESAFRIISAFFRILVDAAERRKADLALIDVGPNLGAINRAAIIASQYVTIPLAPDLLSLQGLKNLGPTLRQWRGQWEERLKKNPDKYLILPEGNMEPAGYVIIQHAMRMDRPVKAYERWMSRIPEVYMESVLGEEGREVPTTVEKDAHRLFMLRHYRSLMPMAMEARKPIFFLKPADGAIGAHANAVSECYEDFKGLAINIANRCDIPLP
ncbi:MAG: ParA family protein [Nitrospinae bacterium]|nr:ParA family protein [Nitrospinota bacterium]